MAKLRTFIKSFTLSASITLLMATTAMSDDIDVYVGSGSTAVGDTLVVFTLDFHSNIVVSTVCSAGSVCPELDELFAEVGMLEDADGDGSHDESISFLELLSAALRKVLGGLNNPDIKVALMAPHDDTISGNEDCVGFKSGTAPQCSNGAYVLSGFKPTDDDIEMEKFFTKLESVPHPDDNLGINNQWDHPWQLKELLFEMYRFVTGGDIYNLQNGLEDYRTDDSRNLDAGDDTFNIDPFNEDPNDSSTWVPELMWDTDALVPNTKTYENTLTSASHCSSLFSVNLTGGGSGAKDDDSDAAIEAAVADGGMGLQLANSNFESRVQVLEFLANNDLDDSLTGTQNLRSFFITRQSGGSGDTGGRANDFARAGGTETALLATNDPDQLVETLSSLFNEILSVSTTFVAASVPANVFNRAETLNEVFLAIFEPAEGNLPFWTGNVKKLTTTTIEETISCEDTTGDGIEDQCETEERKILVDVLEAGSDNPVSAISPLDGRIRPGALTFWTRTDTDDAYLPAPTNAEEEQEFRKGTDGRKVARGGAGQVKPGFLPEDGYSPGDTNDNTSDTTISGPRKLFTEPDDATDGLPGDPLVDLDAESLSNTTAGELLTDSRPYPGGGGVEYGDFLFQTVMENDCSTCTDYSAATDAEQTTARIRVSNLIRFARGWDVDLNTTLTTDLGTVGKRPWWQSDPLHSRPLALNYGARPGFTEERPDIRVLVAGNDGQVQMIRDGRKSDGSEDGVEAWSFLPREFLPLQKRLLEGTVGQYAPGQPDDPDGHKPLHPYAMDGAPTALVIDNDLDGTIETGDGDSVYLFFGQRRGGKRYYALDISDPDAPKFLWSLGKDDAGDDFAELGQNWSLMRAGLMKVDEAGTIKNRPVLVFSGGYNGDDEGDGKDNDGDGFDIADDLGKDSRVPNDPGADNSSGTDDDETIGEADDEGNALFIVNALSGELIWKAAGPPTADATKYYESGTLTFQHPNMVDSVAASPTILDSDGNGFIDRVYFPDTGGNVWRMDAGTPDRSLWTVNKLFEGGRHFQSDGNNDRRFFNAPDVVLASDADGDFDAVVLASGDRARPLGTEDQNWIYMIKDRNTTSGDPPSTPLTHSDLADLTDNCLQDGTTCSDSSVDTNIANGWKVQLEQCDAGGTDPNCGEKALASPLTIEGTIFLTTYLPVLPDTDPDDSDPESCSPKEGSGLFYALDLQNAGGVLNFNPNNDTATEETPERFDKLSSPGIPPEVVAISPNEVLRPDLKIEKTAGRTGSDTFWYQRRFQ